MKIIITGCKGQLGNELVSILSSGRSEIGEIPNALLSAKIVPVDVDELDITDFDAVISCVTNERPDIIINSAAMTNVDGCETMQDIAYKVNAAGVRNLAVAAEQVGAKFIHVSTDYVFAGNGSVPYAEWDKIDPQSIYGKSKALGETYALSFSKKTFIVRTSWLYGYVGKNFVKTVRRVMKERASMTVVNDQRGNPTNANDLAHHILKLAATNEYGIYHCTGKGECTWYEFAKEIVKLSKISGTISPCTSEEYVSCVKRPAFSSLSHLALNCAVGDEMRDWKVALKEYIMKDDD